MIQFIGVVLMLYGLLLMLTPLPLIVLIGVIVYVVGCYEAFIKPLESFDVEPTQSVITR